jgi:hypothetical protein
MFSQLLHICEVYYKSLFYKCVSKWNKATKLKVPMSSYSRSTKTEESHLPQLQPMYLDPNFKKALPNTSMDSLTIIITEISA